MLYLSKVSYMTLIDAARKDDWDDTQLEILGPQAKGKVIFTKNITKNTKIYEKDLSLSSSKMNS